MIRREPHTSRRIPFRVGAIHDWPISAAAARDVLDALQLCFTQATAEKRLDRPVELLTHLSPLGERIRTSSRTGANYLVLRTVKDGKEQLR